MNNGNRAFFADMILVLVTMAWGLSNLLIDLCLEEMQPMTLNAFRFIGAFALISVVMFPKVRTVNRESLKAAVIISILIFGIYALNTYGVMYTSVSNAGFLISLSVLFTPILGIFIKHEIPDKKLIFIAIACTVGIALMTLDSNLRMAFGDVLCLLCALICGVYLNINEIFVKREEINAFHTGVFQIGFAGIWFALSALILEKPAMPQSPKIWGYLLFLMLFSTGFAFIAQSIAQQYTDASRVGVIYTLEPVFSGIAALIVLHEILLPRAYIGELILIVSMVSMELDIGKLFRGRAAKE